MEDNRQASIARGRTLEDIIRNNAETTGTVGSEYVVRVEEDRGHLRCYIRPHGRDGETISFTLLGNVSIIKENS